MSFKDYKTRQKENLNAAVKQAKEIKTKTFEKDPDEWYPTTDKAGNAVVIIRFLPGLETELGADDLPINFVRTWSHNFKNPLTNKWYIEKSLTTLDPNFTGSHPDPLAEYNSKLFAASPKNDKHPCRVQQRSQNRSVRYYSNIFVVGDSNNKENNGKIKRYGYPQGVFNELEKALNPTVVEGVPEEALEEAFNPFDLLEGANLRVTISNDPTKKVNDRPVKKYEFKWLPRGPLFKDEEKIEVIYNEINTDPKWSLLQFIDPKNFKSYDVLHERLKTVMGFDPLAEGAPLQASSDVSASATVARTSKPRTAPSVSAPSSDESLPVATNNDDADEFFASINRDE